MNAANQRSREPVENLYFPQRVSGRYKVHVNHYSNKGDRDPTRFVVLVRVEGRKPMRFNGQISAGQPKQVIYEVIIRLDLMRHSRLMRILINLNLEIN